MDYATHVRPLTEADPVHFPPDLFCLHGLLWAHASCTSRAFPLWLAPGAEDRQHVLFLLLPLLDMFNHRSGAPISWSPCQGGGVEFRLPAGAEPLAVGDEVWNYYGPKSNEELLLNYGFCEAGNQNDCVNLLLRVAAPSGQLRRIVADLNDRQILTAFTGRSILMVGPFRLRWEADESEESEVSEVSKDSESSGPGMRELAAAVAVCAAGRCVAEAAAEDDQVRAELVACMVALQQKLPTARREFRRLAAKSDTARRRALTHTYVAGQHGILAQAIAAMEPGVDLVASGSPLGLSLIFAEEEFEEGANSSEEEDAAQL